MKALAAGFVLYRPGHRYLLLTSARHGDVGLAKGHAEPGETTLATALRETEEEIGWKPARLCTGFRRSVDYTTPAGPKQVVYFAAEAGERKVRLSPEHARADWLPLNEALAALRHEILREVLRDAAIFLKDPALRGTLTPLAARALMIKCVGSGAPVVAHTAVVAEVARELAEGQAGVDADFVEACAWVHDIGRSITHDMRHTLEGFSLLVKAGHAAYAPPCLSHFTKGRPREECGNMGAELWATCDLDTFPIEEQIIALADFHATGDQRVSLENRHKDLVARYGASSFLDGSLALSRRIAEQLRARGT